jgi:3-hydroxyacyl-[acyl-carrier-protein] dehydratase
MERFDDPLRTYLQSGSNPDSTLLGSVSLNRFVERDWAMAISIAGLLQDHGLPEADPLPQIGLSSDEWGSRITERRSLEPWLLYFIYLSTGSSMTESHRPDTTLTPDVLTKLPLESVAIQKILPHRYPFLLIDRVIELERRKRIVAIKNVTVNEEFFRGHFPGNPIMPGVLMVEAIAQAGAAMLMTEIPNRAEMLTVFTGIERAKFRRLVVPGDQLRIEVNVVVWRSTAVKMVGKITVDGKAVCEATVTCRLVDLKRAEAAAAEAASPEIAKEEAKVE